MTLHELLEVLSHNVKMTLYGDDDRLIGYFDYPRLDIEEKDEKLQWCDVESIHVCRENEVCVFIEE